MDTVLKIGGTPYHWIMDSDLPASTFLYFFMVVVIPFCFSHSESGFAMNAPTMLVNSRRHQAFMSRRNTCPPNIRHQDLKMFDSFMSSLGVNVGHTGGSMIAEALVAARGVGAVRNFSRQHFGGGHSSSSSHVNNDNIHPWRKYFRLLLCR